MKSVNLLPAWYRLQQRRHRNLRLHAVAMLCLGALLVGAREVGQRHIDTLHVQRNALAAELQSLPDLQSELRRKKDNLTRLQDLRSAREELGTTVPMSSVLQQIQNAMSQGMALSNVSIEVRPEPLRGSGFVGDPRNPPRYHDVAHFNIVGIAPNDAQIANFIDVISNNPLFSPATLDYTRTGELHRYPVRRFQIQWGMDLDGLTSGTPPEALTYGLAPTAPAGPAQPDKLVSGASDHD